MVKIYASGTYFVKAKEGFESFYENLKSLLSTAEYEVIIATYSIAKSSLPLFDELNRLLERGVTIYLLVNDKDELEVEVVEIIQELELKGLEFFNFRDLNKGVFHAKIIAIDSNDIILGSSNLSWSAFYKNHELNVHLKGSDAIELKYTLMNLLAEFDNA